MFHIAELAYCHCSVVLETAFLCVHFCFQSGQILWFLSLAERTKHEKATRIRKYEQYHGHCCCPYTAIGRCDGCCLDCPYRITDTLSLDQENEYGSNLYDLVATNDCPIDQHCAEKQLLSLVIGRLRELDAEADKMLMIWVQEGVISDREMARRLGRKQSTFAKQINRIRMELRIICKL